MSPSVHSSRSSQIQFWFRLEEQLKSIVGFTIILVPSYPPPAPPASILLQTNSDENESSTPSRIESVTKSLQCNPSTSLLNGDSFNKSLTCNQSRYGLGPSCNWFPERFNEHKNRLQKNTEIAHESIANLVCVQISKQSKKNRFAGAKSRSVKNAYHHCIDHSHQS